MGREFYCLVGGVRPCARYDLYPSPCYSDRFLYDLFVFFKGKGRRFSGGSTNQNGVRVIVDVKLYQIFQGLIVYLSPLKGVIRATMEPSNMEYDYKIKMEFINITIAQLNFRVGDLEGNLKKIADAWASQDHLTHIVVFPELALTGYPPQDLLHNIGF